MTKAYPPDRCNALGKPGANPQTRDSSSIAHDALDNPTDRTLLIKPKGVDPKLPRVSRLPLRLLTWTVVLNCLALTSATAQHVLDSIDLGTWCVGGFAYNPSRDEIYGWAEDSVFVISCSDKNVAAWIPFRDPTGVVYDSIEGKAYCQGLSDTILVVDGTTHNPVRFIQVPNNGGVHHRITGNPASNRVYALHGFWLLAIDTRNDSVVDSLWYNHVSYPYHMVLNSRHAKLYVSYSGFSRSYVTVVGVEPLRFIVDICGNQSYDYGYYSQEVDKYYCDAATNGLLAIDGATDSVVDTVAVTRNYRNNILNWAAGPSTRMFASTEDSVYALNLQTGTLEAKDRVWGWTSDLAWSSASNSVYCVYGDTIVTVLDGTSLQRRTTLRLGGLGTCFLRDLYLVNRHGSLYTAGGSRFVYVIRDTASGCVEEAGRRPPQPREVRPSPARHACMIRLGPATGRCLVSVRSADGRFIRCIRSDTDGRCFWDGYDELGIAVPAGVYYASIPGRASAPIRIVR